MAEYAVWFRTRAPLQEAICDDYKCQQAFPEYCRLCQRAVVPLMRRLSAGVRYSEQLQGQFPAWTGSSLLTGFEVV